MKQNRRTFLRNTTLITGAIAFPGLYGRGQSAGNLETGTTHTEQGDTSSAAVRKQFLSPAKKYRPLVRWWWPGNDVADKELRREIGLLDKAGFGGAEIQAFTYGLAPLKLLQTEMQRVNDYASKSFFRHVGIAADEARNREMFVDYTFGSGWPFGGGDTITPELSAIELRSSHLSVEGPTQLNEKLHIPSIIDGDLFSKEEVLKGLPNGWDERLKKRSRIVAVVAMRGKDALWNGNQTPDEGAVLAAPGRLEKDTAIDLTTHLESEGTLKWDVPAGTWQIFVFCSIPTVQKVLAGAGDSPQLVMDHMNAKAFAAHAKRVGDSAVPYLCEFFGNGLRAIFCDSLEVGAELFWSDDFLSEFRRRRGYDLLPYLPILEGQSTSKPFGEFVDRYVFDIGEGSSQIRNDYRRTVSELITERFYEKFNQWAHDHKLLSRTQAHGAPAEVLRIYGEADIPETEVLYDYGCYNFLKMAASAAHVYGRSIVGSESFVWRNGAYQTTPEKIKIAADELLTAGINSIVYHGCPYVIPQVPPPGWHPFTGLWENQSYSSQINEFNPFWPYLAQLNSYITRMQYISQVGCSISAVALYREDLQHGAEEVAPTPKLNQAVMDAGYNYDHINAESLLRSSVRDRILVTAGGTSYRVLVFPSLDAISAALAEKLHEFAAAGLPILFVGRIPFHADGFYEEARATQQVKASLRAIREFKNVYVSADLDEFRSMLELAAAPDVRFHSDPLPFFQKNIGKMTAYFLRNESDARQHLKATFNAEGKPELWNPWNGEVTAISSYKKKDKSVDIDLDLQPFSSALIVFDPDGTALPLAASTATRSLKRTGAVGTGGWKLIATGLVPSGKTATIHRDLRELIDWSFDSELRGFSGRGVYTTAFTVSARKAGSRLVLDLGQVKDVAEVMVNGKDVARLLLHPYQTDISDFVQTGENRLEITITNALFNSMVLRDPRPFCNGTTDNPSGLRSAGLIGPVQIKVME
jgi:hypothetical protein